VYILSELDKRLDRSNSSVAFSFCFTNPYNSCYRFFIAILDSLIRDVLRGYCHIEISPLMFLSLSKWACMTPEFVLGER